MAAAILVGFLAGLLAMAARPSLDAEAAVPTVRGVYRFSSTSWQTMAGYGFNWVTDGGVTTNYYSGQRAAGLTGMVWLDAYDNSSCTQTMTDAEIAQVVRANATHGNRGAVYQVGDEPTTRGCNASPTYSHMTSVIHGADPSARSWVADDQFNDPSTDSWPAGLPMKGAVDILAFDIYPCQAGACRYDMIDLAIRRIHTAGLRSWEFILQDFGPCQSWRAPSAGEVMQQFLHWRGAGALGYWVYTFDRDSTPCPGNVAGGAVLLKINAMVLNPGATATSPTPRTTPSAPPPVSPSSATRPTPSGASHATTPAPSASGWLGPPFRDGKLSVWALVLLGIGLLLVLVAGGLGYWRRRFK